MEYTIIKSAYEAGNSNFFLDFNAIGLIINKT